MARSCGGLAGVDGLRAQPDAFLEIGGQPGGDQGCGGVQQDDVAARAGDAGEHVVEQSLVGGDVAAGELIEGGAGQPGHLRGDAGGVQGGFAAGLGFLDARNDGFAGGGQLVNAVGPVDDEGAFGTQRS